MATTPLYKHLKKNGNSFYAFPGASEDISASYQNANYKMYFSKYVLLNIPKQNLTAGSQSSPIYFDFDNSFRKSLNSTPPTTFGDQIVESLRNYVANQEIVIRESRLNTSQYYYDTNALETTSEKIFFKWCKKLGLIDFEPAIPDDEYFSNLPLFERRNKLDDQYLPEYLWKEREVIEWDAISFYETAVQGFNNKLEISFNGVTNLKVGDTIRIFNVSNSVITENTGGDDLLEMETETGFYTKILYIIDADSTNGQRIVVDVLSVLGNEMEATGQVELVYHRLIQYVGEVNGVSNVQEANRSYTEVYAHIPDHTGMTPDVLFRTTYDVNYKPNLVFPIIPNQYQPEILGAENFACPIVSSPQNYPGSYFGQFDTLDFTYETSPGDSIRRNGDYFGVKGDINNPIVNTSKIDGIGLDFNTSHYVKMNIVNRKVTNFEQFNSLEINNNPPNDFEFNAILWYYTVEDTVNNSSSTNLYGISFLDNPENNPDEKEVGLRFPTYKKLVSNGQQDGSSYAFSLNLNFNIINDNPQQTYNPEAINSMFGMNLFNSAMQRLASLNDSFINIIAENSAIKDEVIALKGLLYTQTDINTINSKIRSLEDLLRLYSTNQLMSSESVNVITLPGSPPRIKLENIDSYYFKIDNIKTSELYTPQGAIPINLNVPKNKDFLVNIINNDEVPISLPNDEKLKIILDRDLDYKQSVEFFIKSNEFASQNKKLDIYLNSDITTNNGLSQILLYGNIDLPVNFNLDKSLPNSAYLWKDFSFNIDFNKNITLKNGPVIEIPIEGNTYLISNSIKSGDTLLLNNLFVGTQSVYDFSGQYRVSNVGGGTSSYITLDVSTNPALTSYSSSNELPMLLHSSTSTMLSNKPYFTLNKGKKIIITRVSPTATILSERYKIEILDLK